MFVRAEIVLNTNFDAACSSLSKLVHDEILTEVSEGAYDSGLVGLLRVGPIGDVRGMSKLVRVYARDLVMHDNRALLTVRWEATGFGGGLFPALDADLTLTPAGPDTSRLELDGAYRPPLAALGASLDRMILNRVAAQTARSLLTRIGQAITAPEPAREPATPGLLQAAAIPELAG